MGINDNDQIGFDLPIKKGTLVITDDIKLGLFLYTHKEPKNMSTICSVYNIRAKKIVHIPLSDLKIYNNVCWNCHYALYSNIHYTCPACHWLICPNCGACSRDICKPAEIIVVDEICDFIDKYYEFYEYWDYEFNGSLGFVYIGFGEAVKMEKYYISLLENNIQVILWPENYGWVSLYIRKQDRAKAFEILSGMKATMYYDMEDALLGHGFTRIYGDVYASDLYNSNEGEWDWLVCETSEELYDIHK